MTRTNLLTVLLLLTLTPMLGCSTKTSLTQPTPEKLGRIGAAVDQNPDRMEAILKEHDLTVEEFESAVNRVSSDPELAKRYREGFSEGPGEE